LKFTANDDANGEDSAIELYSDDAEVPLRLQLNGAYTKDNYGVVFGVRGEPAADGLPVKVYNAYGWVTFLNEIIKVSAGKIDDGSWGTQGVQEYSSSGNGVRLEVTPIEGLNFGLILTPPDDLLATNIKDFVSETHLGAKYSNDLFWAAGALKIDSQGDGLTGFQSAPSFDWWQSASGPVVLGPGSVEPDHGFTFYIGAGAAPIPGLAFAVEAKGVNQSKFAKAGEFVLDEKVGYKLLDDKLEVGLKARQYFWGDEWSKGLSLEAIEDGKDDPYKPYLTFTPYVGYDVLDNVNVAFEVGLGLWSGVLDSDLSFKPKVTYKIGDGAKIVAFYKLAITDPYDDFEPGFDRKTNKGNTVQIDMIWTF
jgi:hypothetical protein